MIKRKVLTIGARVEIIRRLENGEKNKDVAKEYGMPSSTISSLWKNRDSHLKAFQNNKTESKRLKRCDRPDVDDALAKWCRAQVNAGLPLTGALVRSQGNKFAKEFGYSPCSNGWLDRFKNRHNIVYTKGGKEKRSKKSQNLTDNVSDWIHKMWQDYTRDRISEEIYSQVISSSNKSPDQFLDISEATTNWLETMWLDYRSEYSEDDIYNAEEIGLFFNLLPDQIKKYKGEKCSEGEFSENRLTALICTNMSGTDKRKLLVIGHSANPTCFKDLKQLPVDYVANHKAWMTPEIFTDYAHKWDSEMRKKDRKIILLIDNGIAHTDIKNLSNIKLVFLPPNSAPALLPLHQGIIRSFKTSYRKGLIMLLNDKMKKEMDLKISLLEAIRFMNDAWYDVPSEYIRNCFVKAMLQNALDTEENECSLTEWMILENIEVFKEVKNIEDFIGIDDNVLTSGIPTVQEIILETKTDHIEVRESNNENTAEVPTLTEAIEYADGLQCYLETVSCNDDDIFQALNLIRHKLREQRKIARTIATRAES